MGAANPPNTKLHHAQARSHSGYGWEGVLPYPVHPICDGTSCTIDVDVAGAGAEGGGGGYRVDAHVRPVDETPTEAESTARLLLQGTFGPTNAAITEALDAAGKGQQRGDTASDLDTAVATAWVDAQLKLPVGHHLCTSFRSLPPLVSAHALW